MLFSSLFPSRLLVLLFAATTVACASDTASAQPATDRVMRRVFDWQVAHPWSTSHSLDDRHGTRGWIQGAFLTGVMEAYRGTGDAAYLKYAEAIAETNAWRLGERRNHADDEIVGQTYLELHELAPSPTRIEHTRASLDALLSVPTTGRQLWWWCDALYMAPPTFAKLAQATGDVRYLEALERFYWDACEAFYDPAERLCYRDQRFAFPATGPKIFWSRGNGWVLAGLSRLIDALPKDYAPRQRYVDRFREMAARVVALQGPDGLWGASLLQAAPHHGEASGSAFFCYALAWGINHEVLPAKDYRPAVDRAWDALVNCVDETGRLGWVQPIGFAPDAYDASTSQEYGAGAFLAAGAQMRSLR